MAFGDFLNSINVQGQWMEVFSSSLYLIGIVFWTLLGIAGVLVVYYYFSFNIPTHIYEIIGKNQTLKFLRKTRSRIFTKDNVSHFKIFGVKQKLVPPQSEDYMIGKKGKLLNIIKDGTDYRFLNITSNPGHILIQDHDMRFWHTQQRVDIIKKYTELTFFQKYGAYLVFIFGILVLGWMYYIQLKYINGNLAETTSAANKLAEAIGKNLRPP